MVNIVNGVSLKEWCDDNVDVDGWIEIPTIGRLKI